jgi:hypothetical protein
VSTSKQIDTSFPGYEETKNWAPAVPGDMYVGTATADQVDFDEAMTGAAEYLDDWPLVEKIRLVGKPFAIVGVNAFEGIGDDGLCYNVRIVLKDKTGFDTDHVSFNDGSAGVYTQLKDMLAKMDRPRPIGIKGGLRVSRYYWNEKEQQIVKEKGPHCIEQSTYYLCSSPEMALKSIA